MNPLKTLQEYGNALITPQGNIAIIDPIIYLNTADEDYDGSRVLGDVY